METIKVQVQVIVRTTRQALELPVREFSTLVGAGMPDGCSHATTNNWELGRNTPSYTDMFYLYTHTTSPAIQGMAGAIMQILKPGNTDMLPGGRPAVEGEQSDRCSQFIATQW